MTSTPNFQKELEAMKKEIQQVTTQASEMLNSSREAFEQLAAGVGPKVDEAAKVFDQSQKTVETLTAAHPFAALAAAFAFGAVIGLSLRK